MKTTADKMKLFLKLCSILFTIALILLILHIQGYRINLSNSLPDKIYRISKITDKPINRGEFVVVDFSMIANNSTINTGLERKYLDRLPMIKKIGAVPGDVVTLQNSLLYINGKELSPMIILSEDSRSNPLTQFPTPVTLQSDQYWLISNPAGGFDSRYFGWISRDCITHTALPVLN
jgi:conjugative transfer signal peptidase TraF